MPTSETHVDFYDHCYTGTIPSEYGLLTGVTLMHLSFDQLTGAIPTGG